MQHSLLQQVRTLGRVARRWLLLYAVSVTLLLGLAVLLGLGLADYILRIEDPGLRFLSTGVLLATLAAAAGWFLLPAWRYRPSDLQLARRLEERHPELADRLSSALAFASQDEEDRYAGSVPLRRAAIAEASAAAAEVDWRGMIDRRAPSRAAALAAALLLAALGFLAADPSSAGLALRRVATPWAAPAWPRWNSLAFLQAPTRLALGQTLAIEVHDLGGRLPDTVELEFRELADEGVERVIRKPMKPLAGRMVFEQEDRRVACSYRAVGGDDATDWVELELVEPPKIEQVAVVLESPPHTGWPRQTGFGLQTAWVGSRVWIEGTADRELQGAEVRALGSSEGAPRMLHVEGRRFYLSSEEPAWEVAESGRYQLTIYDRDGLPGTHEQPWEIRAVEDQPPSVELPPLSQSGFATPQGVLVFPVTARDDLALARLELRYFRSDRTDEGEQQLVIWEAAPSTPPAAAEGVWPAPGEQRTWEFRWNLEELEGLSPGAVLNVSAAAADHLPQWGRSGTRRLTILTREEMADRVAQRRGMILSLLSEVLQTQRAAAGQVEGVAARRRGGFPLARRDVDELQAAEFEQRRVGQRLAGPQESVLTQVAELHEEIRANGLEGGGGLQRLLALREVIERLARDPLPRVESSLVAGMKGGRVALQEGERGGAPAVEAAVADHLAAAGAGQREVIAALEQLLGDLRQWDNYRRFAREFAALRREQEQLRNEAEPAAREVLGRLRENLPETARSTIDRLERRQLEVSRQFERLLAGMREMQADLGESDPLAADTLADALEIAARLETGLALREAARQLELLRIGRALELQERGAAELGEIADALLHRRIGELARRGEQLRRAEEEIKELRERQEGLTEAIGALRGETEPERRELQRLVEEQRRAEDHARRLGRRLERLEAEEARGALARAERSMGRGAEAGEGNDTSGAAAAGAQAERDLEEAAAAAGRAAARAERDLLEEQLAQWGDAVRGVHRRQEGVLRETERLQALRREGGGEWTRGQVASVQGAAERQRELVLETAALAEQAEGAKGFLFALRAVGGDMRRAAQRLGDLLADDPTTTAQRSALERLAQVVQALEERQGEQASEGNSGEEGGEAGDGSPDLLAQLLLLQWFQRDLAERTAQFDQILSRRELSPEEAAELEQLAREQLELSEVLRALRQGGEGGNAAPAELPPGFEEIREPRAGEGASKPPEEE